MKNRNWLWGLFFIVGAVLLVLSASGLELGVTLWQLFVGFVCVGIILKSLFKLEFFGIFLPLAVMFWFFRGHFPYPVSDMRVWPIFLAAVFLSIGCSILFKRKKKKFPFVYIGRDCDGSETENLTGSVVHSSVSFGDAVKYVYSDSLEKGKFECSFGAMQIHLEQATLKDNFAVIEVACSFGGMDIYVPKEWNVQNSVTSSFGDATDNTRHNPANTSTIHIIGGVSFGGVDIHSV